MIRSASFVSMLLATPTLAADRCEGGPRADWQSPDAARAIIAAEGYGPVTDMYIEDGCYELVTSTSDGATVEVLLDPVTLEVALIEDPD